MLTIERFYQAGQENPEASILLHQDEVGNKTLQPLASEEEQLGSFQGAVVTTAQASQHKQTKEAFLTALKQEF